MSRTNAVGSWTTATLLAGVTMSAASAHVFDISGDFSYSGNPNGQWAYEGGTALLGYAPAPLPGPPAPASTDGYWGSAWEAIVFRATLNSSQTPGYGADDWLAGDVIVYTPDSGANVRVTWTAPCDGTINYTGAAWYASTIVSRSDIFTLTLNGGPPLANGVLDPTKTRSNAITFASQAPIVVSGGDVLALTFVKNAGQSFGSFAGSILAIDFDPAAKCAADLDGDCAVGGADIGILLSTWGPCAGCSSDINGDGVVDGADLGIILGAWGACG
ncbi:MAG: hypothetical protein U0575_07530 [Phycisphaerales bacterium]